MPMDDLTIMSSTRADMQESSGTTFPQSPPSAPLEISPRQIMYTPAKRSLSFGVLDHPNLKMGRFLVLLAACIYGSNFSIVKLLDDTMPLSVSATLRFGLAAAVVSALVLSRESDDVDAMVKKERSMAFWGGVEIGLWYCIGYIAQAEGLQTVAAGKSAFFNALAVVVVPILDVLFKSKVLKKIEVASVLIACLGVGLLELGPEGGLKISSGDVLAFMQTIFFGVGYWRLESESHQHSHQAGRITSGQLSAVAFGSLIYAVTECGFGHLEMSSTSQIMDWFSDPFIIGSLVWAGLISTALALYLETVALKVVSATELTLLMTTTSLWGAAFAFVSLGEVLNPTGMVGGLLIMGGCILGNLSPPEGKPADDLILRRWILLQPPSARGKSTQLILNRS